MSVARYSILVPGVAAAALVLAWPLGLRSVGAAGRWAVAYGGAIAAVNTVTAFALVRWSERRSTVAFMRAVLGGTMGRMVFMLAAFVLGVTRLGLPPQPLVASLLAFFVLFLVLELSILHRPAGPPARAAQ